VPPSEPDVDVSALSPAWVPSPEGLRRGGTVVLWAGLLCSIAVVLGLAWAAPEVLPFVPVLALGASAVAFLLRRPELHLYAVLLCSAAVLEHQPGVQVTEVVYGVYAMFFLATWFALDIAGRKSLWSSTETKLLLLFGLYVVALIPVAFLHGGTSHTVVRELTSLTMLAFLFPIRDVCSRSERGVRVLLLIGAGLSMFVVVRNLVVYRTALNDADRLSEMIGGRVIANDHVMAAAGLASLVFLLHAKRPLHVAGLAAVFMLSVGGLLLTLSRGFWLAFVWGLLFIVVTVDRQHKARLVVYGALAALTVVSVGVLFFGNLVSLFLDGLVERLFSVSDSLTKDVSMLGRVYEARGAFREIAENPVLGHGAGVPFTFSSILTRTESTTVFIHNGYIYLWYAFGLLGTALMLALGGRAIWAGLQTYRAEGAPRVLRLTGLGAAASLFAFTLSALTSNPFYHKDYLLGLAFLMGLAYGVRAHQVSLARTDEPS
jgi:O-antigen ligase